MSTLDKTITPIPRRDTFNPLLIVLDVLGIRKYDHPGMAVSASEVLIVEKVSKEVRTAQRYDIVLGPSTGNVPEGAYFVPIFSSNKVITATPQDVQHFLEETLHDRCLITAPAQGSPWLLNKTPTGYEFQPFLESTLALMNEFGGEHAELAERVSRLSKEYQATSNF